jgi:hypothetical protein
MIFALCSLICYLLSHIWATNLLWFPAGANNFSLLQRTWTGFGAPIPSDSVGPKGVFLTSGSEADCSPSRSVKISTPGIHNMPSWLPQAQLLFLGNDPFLRTMTNFCTSLVTYVLPCNCTSQTYNTEYTCEKPHFIAIRRFKDNRHSLFIITFCTLLKNRRKTNLRWNNLTMVCFSR